MSLIDYGRLLNVYSSGRMGENVRRLERYDLFHCLLAGSPEHVAEIKRRVACLPEDFLCWLKVCDGGLLFDTVMLTTRKIDPAAPDAPLMTYNEFSDEGTKVAQGPSGNCFVFATAVNSDVFYFDVGKKNVRVCQWESEERVVCASWATFEDWLTDRINEAMELIARERLEPVGFKLEDAGHE